MSGDDPSLIENLPTLVATEVDSARATVSLASAPIEEMGFAARYRERSLLGTGGMGEVHLCHDNRIGRDVAMKVIRAGFDSRGGLRARFEREARVQAQLEHPSVVPVYDVGLTPAGQTFFTMKRVRGQSLDAIIGALSRRDPSSLSMYSRRRLLTVFSNVCLAIAYAHARAVVHRDLKPANVMLGEFGEVNVLDWGLAKVSGVADLTVEPVAAELATEHQTAAGALMGTPGYMPPEQVRGEAVDARADVYALGAILFELLALSPLHRGPSPVTLAASTLADPERRPSARAPDAEVPPELDAICVRATAPERDDRYASAREMADAIERFLDGARDLALREELAAGHAERAEHAASRVWAGPDDADADAARAEAIREASRALAFNPTHESATTTIVRLLLEPPRVLPPEAEADLAAGVQQRQRAYARSASRAVLAILLLVPLLLWQGVRSWLFVGVMIAVTAALGVVLRVIPARRAVGDRLIRWGFLLTMGMVASTAPLFGPFVLMPSLLVASTLMTMITFGQDRSSRRWLVGLGALALLLPFAAELLGLLPPSTAFRDGALLLLPRAVSFPALPSLVFLAVSSLAVHLFSSSVMSRAIVALSRAERRLFAHNWQLRHVLPGAARALQVVAVPTK